MPEVRSYSGWHAKILDEADLLYKLLVIKSAIQKFEFLIYLLFTLIYIAEILDLLNL